MNTLVGDPNATETFKTIELTGQKRLSNGWQVLASYSATKSDIPVPAESNINPNIDILAANETWEWLFRASSAYVFPRNVMVSANFEHRSGDVQARTVSLTRWRDHSDDHAEGRAHRQPSPAAPKRHGPAGLKAVRSRRGRRLEGQINLFNVMNANTVTARNCSIGCELPEADGDPCVTDSGFQHRV